MRQPVPALLWSRIREKLPVSEHNEVRSVLGDRAIDENDVLHAELSSLLEILSDLQLETDELSVGGRAAAKTLLRDQAPTLQVSQQRELLEQEIRFFLDNLQRRGETPTGAAASLETPRDRKVLNYMIKTQQEQQQQQQVSTDIIMLGEDASNAPGHVRTVIPRQRTPDELASAVSSPSPGVARMEQLSVNVFTLEQVEADLREALCEERERLLHDIESVTDAIESEHEHQTRLREFLRRQQQIATAKAAQRRVIDAGIPSLQELREFAKKLEHAWRTSSVDDVANAALRVRVPHHRAGALAPLSSSTGPAAPRRPCTAPAQPRRPRSGVATRPVPPRVPKNTAAAPAAQSPRVARVGRTMMARAMHLS